MTWRYWGSIPSSETPAATHTEVIPVTKATGQFHCTLTYTDAALNQVELTALGSSLAAPR